MKTIIRGSFQKDGMTSLHPLSAVKFLESVSSISMGFTQQWQFTIRLSVNVAFMVKENVYSIKKKKKEMVT